MDSIYSRQANRNFPGPSVNNISTKSEFPKDTKVTENSRNSRIQGTKLASGVKMSLKIKREGEPPISKKIISTIKNLNMSKGSTAEAISEFMGEYYGLNKKLITPRIKTFLGNGVQNGILEQMKEGNTERFKIKDTEHTSFETKPQKTGLPNLKNQPKMRNHPKTQKIATKKKKLSTSEMVLETISALKMSKRAATLGSICEHMRKHYSLSSKTLTPDLNKYLKNGVRKGFIQEISRSGNNETSFKVNMERMPVQGKNKVAEKSRKPYLNTDAKNHTIFKKGSPLTPAMVIETIKSLRMRKGAPVESIGQYIEKHYGVNLKTALSNIKRYLKNGVHKGILEQVDGTGNNKRFKIKKIGVSKMNRRALKV